MDRVWFARHRLHWRKQQRLIFCYVPVFLCILKFAVRFFDGCLSTRKRFAMRFLRGKPEGFHSIRVNSQWRLIFRWDGGRGEASAVNLDDHSYR
jgi:hypothetical protein